MFQTYEIATNPNDGPPRLERLREAMAKAGVDAFIVPRTDMYRGENVADCDERLRWLTGFTGSAGMALITKDEAAVLIDGRYTLQVRDQVDLDHFTPMPYPKTEPGEYLAQVLENEAVVGFDPWLLVKNERARYLKRFGAKSITLQPVANLVDQIWDDRPAAPKGLAVAHPETLAGEPHEAKIARLAENLKTADLAAAVITVPESLAWLLNMRGSDIGRTPVVHCVGVLHAAGKVDLYIAPAKVDEALKSHLGASVTVHDFDGFLPALAAMTGRVQVDSAATPIAVLDALSDAELVFERDPCVIPRATKNAVEIEGARRAHLRDGAAMIEFLTWFDGQAPKGDLTEIDVAQKLEGFRRAGNGLRDISFETISGAGPNGAIVHYRVNKATNRSVEPGSLMLVDSGGQYADGTTDITRTICVGDPPEGAKHAFTLVLKGMIALSRLRWPEGLAGRDIDVQARAALWAAGFDYDHGTGHGVGSYLGVHEGPASISRRSHEPILPGMIMSNEPGYYREGAFGIRIENLLVANAPADIDGGDRPMMGFETLTFTPIDTRLVDAALLTQAELDWLNAYHNDVRQRYQDEVSTAASTWLVEATKPL